MKNLNIVLGALLLLCATTAFAQPGRGLKTITVTNRSVDADQKPKVFA